MLVFSECIANDLRLAASQRLSEVPFHAWVWVIEQAQSPPVTDEAQCLLQRNMSHCTATIVHAI